MIDFGDSFIRNDPVQTLRNFSSSRVISQRQTYSRVLEHILESVSPELMMSLKDDIIATLDVIAKDTEMEVRASLVGNGNMIAICISITQHDQNFLQSFGVHMLDRILLIVLRYLSDEPSVRKGANSTLLYLIENGFLDKTVISSTVCPVIADLLNIDEANGEQDKQQNAIGVMAKVAPIIGTEKANEVFFAKFMELTQCDIPNIRKQCAAVFPVMCEVLGSDILESNLLPLFVKLCDDSTWNIRNTCAQTIAMISILCSLRLRREYLVPIMKKFMFDESRWVLTSALNSLGEFLATFAQPPIIGLAYNFRLELFITNAADQDFRQQCQSNMILYSNQPNSSEIFKNLEKYEKEFEKELLIGPSCGGAGDNLMSFKSPLVLNMSSKLSPISGAARPKKVNIETYLLSIINASHFNDRMNASGGRLSSTAASESDESELFSLQSPTNAATLLKQFSSTPNNLNESGRNDDDSNNGDDPFSKFLRFNTPLKNNFTNRIRTPETVESTFVWHGFGGNYDNGGDYDFEGNAAAEQDEDDEDEDDLINFSRNLNKSVKSYSDGSPEGALDAFEKKLNNLTLRDKPNNNFVGTSDSTDDAEQEKFNSHQYWYIEPAILSTTDLADDLVDQLVRSSKVKEENDRMIEEFAEVEQVEAEMPENDSSLAKDQSTLLLDEDIDIDSDNENMRYESRDSQLTVSLGKTLEQETEKNDSAEVEWTLIEDFIYMKEIENNLSYKCAHSFPAVMLMLGKQFWPLLHQHFLSLCNDLQSTVRVRKTIAKSIYQIALIIGSDLATKDLVAPFVELFKDVDDVKLEVVKQVCNFIKVVDPSKHEIIVNQLEMCLQPPINVVNWRLREQIGIQIVELNKLGPRIQKENCPLYLSGLALKLMMDKYDCVRKVGIDAFVSCVERIKQKKQLLNFLSFHFANSARWRERQVYILAVVKLLERRAIKPELFNNHILKKLLELVADGIPNIRLCIAKLLSTTLMQNPYYNNELREWKKNIQQQIDTLGRDPDRDVRHNVFSALSEREKAESPPSDNIPAGIPVAVDASRLETVHAILDGIPVAVEAFETGEAPPPVEHKELPPPTDMIEENARADVKNQPTKSEA